MESKGISKLDLKRRNRRQILIAIRNAGQLARVDIAAQLSLTRAAVTIITNQMIAQGILEDMNTPVVPPPDAPKKKGRRKTMIRINPNYKFVLGAMVEEDFVSVGLSNLDDDVLGKATMPLTEQTDPQEVVQFIVKSCRDLADKASLKKDMILGLGVGIVQQHWGMFDAEILNNGIVSFEKIRRKLDAELSVPVFCGNATGLYALANLDYTEKRHRCQMLLYSGASFQTAVVQDGELLGGLNADSASVDRIILTPGGRKAAGYPDGSVHAEITAAAMCAMFEEATGKKLTIDEICDAYDADDKDAVRITNEVVDKLAVMIYNLCATHRASRVVLQSYRIRKGAMKRLQEQVTAMAGVRQDVKLVRSIVEGDKSFLAGCKLVMERQFFDLGGLQINTEE